MASTSNSLRLPLIIGLLSGLGLIAAILLLSASLSMTPKDKLDSALISAAGRTAIAVAYMANYHNATIRVDNGSYGLGLAVAYEHTRLRNITYETAELVIPVNATTLQADSNHAKFECGLTGSNREGEVSYIMWPPASTNEYKVHTIFTWINRGHCAKP